MLTESSGSVLVEALVRRFEDRDATIGIIGLGYVGLPLGVAAAEAGLTVLGFDIDPGKVEHVNGGRSYINYIADESIARLVRDRQLSATDSFGRLGEVDAILICVPTPLTRHREPDLSMVVETGRQIARRLRKGQLVVLESTTYPGTTNDVLRPILQESGLQVGEDFLLAYSPEREDPGNPDFSTTGVPKVVGADDESALKAAVALYRCVFQSVVQVPGTGTAEAVKLTENIFRAVNIALVNELKILFSAMGIDIWDVIAAAKTKPFGFMPFYPGPGLGGHCIPIDPFYLTWKAREYEISTRFIELAGEINTSMPNYVVSRLSESMDRCFQRGINGAKVLIIGLAYKKNVSDTRESPSLKLFELIEGRGGDVDYHDPYVPQILVTREHESLAGRRSVELQPTAVSRYDAVLITTDHDCIDYRLIVENARLVLDTRNVCARNNLTGGNIVKA